MATRRPTRLSRRGELLVSVADAVEMIQTEGSDIEGEDSNDVATECEPSEEEFLEESANESASLATQNSSATDSSEGESAGEKDDFFNVFTSDWADDFSFSSNL